MKKNLDVLLRINDSKISVNNTITTRIQEHMKLLNEKDSVIWGQSTSGKRKIAKSKVQIINQNIRDRGYIFVFFVSKKKNCPGRNVLIGKCSAIYEKNDINQQSSEIEFIPNYYSNIIGTDSDDNYVLFNISEVANIEESDLENLYYYSNNKKQLSLSNQSSLFYVTMEEEYENYLENQFRK